MQKTRCLNRWGQLIEVEEIPIHVAILKSDIRPHKAMAVVYSGNARNWSWQCHGTVEECLQEIQSWKREWFKRGWYLVPYPEIGSNHSKWTQRQWVQYVDREGTWQKSKVTYL